MATLHTSFYCANTYNVPSIETFFFSNNNEHMIKQWYSGQKSKIE